MLFTPGTSCSGVQDPINNFFNLVRYHTNMMFNTELSYAGHSRRFVLGHLPVGGWELLIQEDDAVVSRVRYTDWHRVERALAAVSRRISELEARGWQQLSLAEPTARID